MATNQRSNVFELVPDEWLEPVVGLWVIVLAIAGMVLTLEVTGAVLVPLGGSAITGILVTVAVAGLAYGVFGIGLTFLYLRHRDIEPGFVVESFDRSEWHWFGRLTGLFFTLVVVGGVVSRFFGSSFEVITTHLWIGSFPLPDGLRALALASPGMQESPIGIVPVVIFIAVLSGLLVGPAVGALFHGVLQNTLTQVVSPTLSFVGTALAATVAVNGFTFHGVVGFSGISTTVAVFIFSLAVAYAYRETENLLLPMAAYGLFSAFSLMSGWFAVVVVAYLTTGSL